MYCYLQAESQMITDFWNKCYEEKKILIKTIKIYKAILLCINLHITQPTSQFSHQLI